MASRQPSPLIRVAALSALTIFLAPANAWPSRSGAGAPQGFQAKSTDRIEEETQTIGSGVTSHSIVTDLWDGLDFPDESFSLERLARKPTVDTKPEAHVQVLGLHNSGVDLLNSLLYSNFGYRLNYYGQSVDAPNQNRQGLWHHANLKEVWGQVSPMSPYGFRQRFYNGTDVKSIILVRNPLSWLLANRLNGPEELDCGRAEDGEEWLTKTCEHQRPGGHGTDVPAKEFANIEGVWNQWTEGYLKSASFGLEHALVVPYEGLVREPQQIMQNIAHFLQIKPPTTVLLPDDSSKMGMKAAQDALWKKTYMKLLTDKDLRAACSHFDKNLLHMRGYVDCFHLDSTTELTTH